MTGVTMRTVSFSRALELLKDGNCVQRLGWNGKGMYLYLVSGSTFVVNRPPLNELLEEGTVVIYKSHIDMKTADGFFVPWLASQSDLIEEDWVMVTPEGTKQEQDIDSFDELEDDGPAQNPEKEKPDD